MMPNMFGGSQDHPAYDPRWTAAANEDCIGQILYRVVELRDGWCCVAVDVSGNTHKVAPPTDKLRTLLEEKLAA